MEENYSNVSEKTYGKKPFSIKGLILVVLVIWLGIILTQKHNKGMPIEMRKQANTSPMGGIDWEAFFSRQEK